MTAVLAREAFEAVYTSTTFAAQAGRGVSATELAPDELVSGVSPPDIVE